MVSFLRASLLCLLLATSTTATRAAEPMSCTIIVDVKTADVLVRDGICDQRVPPFSSFKLPLAVMGFETGILIDGHTPRWEWTPDITAPERDHKSVDPTEWERDSVLWYSRKLVQAMGGERLAGLVDRFDYGNRDVSGVPGKANGMTHAWIGASLTISPEEQVHFVRRLLLGALPVSAAAQTSAAAILPSFEAKDGWVLTGKTGSGWLTDSTGAFRKDRSMGWFIGWADRGDERVAFARLLVDNRPRGGALGPTLRDSLVIDLPDLLAR
jgi:beta-lactamase class D